MDKVGVARDLQDPPITANNGKTIRMIYENYRGELSERQVIPDRIWFGATSYHPASQWLMDAFDLEKSENRTFALNDIKQFIQN